jgi:hypothetical protein
MRGEATIGTEFIPHEDVETGARIGIDLRFTFGYVSEGRDYHPLFDHFGNSRCQGKTLEEVTPEYSGERITNPDDVACSWIAQQPSNTDDGQLAYDLVDASQNGRNPQFFFDGMTTVESYATFQGQIGVYIQPVRYFQLELLTSLTHQQEHFITNARTGRDAPDDREEPGDADDTVDLQGADSTIERNPVHNPTLDSSANRFRVQEFNTWSFLVNAALQF